MVKIIADTTSSLPLKTARRLNIPMIPQLVNFGEESYRDGYELDSNTFLQKLQDAKELPKTSAPPPAEYDPFYTSALANGESVIVVAPSALVSGTVRSALTAAQNYPELDIQVFDTKTIAGNLATLVLQAHHWAEQGLGADEITARLAMMAEKQKTYLLVDTLEYLQKGGRIGGARALLGTMLRIKPLLSFENGQVEAYAQVRTKRLALQTMIDTVQRECPPTPDAHLCVMHAGAAAAAAQLQQQLSELTGLDEIPIYNLPPAVIVHTGPGTLGVGFFTE